MRLALAPKVAVVKEDTAVAEEDEGEAEEDKVVAEENEGEDVVSNHRDTTDKIQSYNISPNRVMGSFPLPLTTPHSKRIPSRAGQAHYAVPRKF